MDSVGGVSDAVWPDGENSFGLGNVRRADDLCHSCFASSLAKCESEISL